MPPRLHPLAFAICAIAIGTWLAVGLVPADPPTPDDPSFVDNIFDSRLVIWAARLLLLSTAVVLAVGGVFIVGSTITRMRQGDWLKRAGPFEVSEHNVLELARERDFWRSVAEDSHRRLIELEDQLNTPPDIEADMGM